ncbi:MAG: shikimate dehydrogenase [Calditrichaeota bacterium]|nr:shikimate dehydrogenase [Calditrichota bacterium]
MPDAKTGMLGVIGDPIEHSLSPIMHNFIFQKLGLNFCYHAFRVIDRDLPHAIDGFRALNFRGINVTLPHKQNIIQYLDEVHDDAAQLAAVNTVLFSHGKALGFNTDVKGFMNAVINFGVNLEGEKAILLGAGGSARAVALGLLRLGCKEIAIYNRSLPNAQIMAAFLVKKTGISVFFAHDLKDRQLYRDVENAAILVNATNVGMAPDIEKSPLPYDLKLNSKMFVFDLIYNPAETALLSFARKQGVQIQNGLEMLIFQGIASLEIWLGKEIDVSNFFNNLKNKIIEALEENG